MKVNNKNVSFNLNIFLLNKFNRIEQQEYPMYILSRKFFEFKDIHWGKNVVIEELFIGVSFGYIGFHLG